jgi:uncharacterized membrane protein
LLIVLALRRAGLCRQSLWPVTGAHLQNTLDNAPVSLFPDGVQRIAVFARRCSICNVSNVINTTCGHPKMGLVPRGQDAIPVLNCLTPRRWTGQIFPDAPATKLVEKAALSPPRSQAAIQRTYSTENAMTDQISSTTGQSGLTDNNAGALAYVTIIPAIIFLVMEPYNKNPFIKFHAWQSIFFCIAAVVIDIILGFIPFIGWVIIPLFGLLLIVVWILLVLKASKGEKFKLPFIGNFAEKQANA